METKKCSKCGRELPLTEFYSMGGGRKRADCKQCHSEYMKQQYSRKKQALEKQKEAQTCAKCGESRGYVLDYHHLDSTQKENTISRMTSNKYRLEDIQKEAEKCIVLCSNCHREFHHFEKINNLTIEEYLKK